MNVKTITNNITSVLPQAKTDDAKAVKSEQSSQDRDADGRRQSENTPQKEEFSQEEILKALNYLKNLEGVKANNIFVSYENVNDTVVYFLKEPNGKIIKRLIGADVWSLMISEVEKGHLLDRAM